MCGITGICRPARDASVDPAVLRRMTEAIEHRGPDGDGFHFDAGVGLGHRRLSIIDLDGGDQPIHAADGNLTIVFNGEIYNYKELRSELIAAGYRFKTESDTEVIVHLYDQLGADCVHRLNGMFAFSIWDKRSRTLFVARDRLGEKPFYYWHKPDGTIVFASEIKSIVAASENPGLTIDTAALDDYLAYGYVPAPKSIYKEIRKLPAAHTLTWTSGQVKVEQYWSHRGIARAAVGSIDDALAELSDLLHDSVRLRLRSDVPVGAFLSGGIDSSLIVAFASEVAASPLTTFSVGFSEEEFDESGYARQVAERYGTTHHQITVQDINLDFFPEVVRQFDEPFADPSALPTYYVTHAASQHLKVCLSGDAGDELFAGYPQYVLEPGERLLNAVPGPLRRLIFGSAAMVVPTRMRGKGWLRRMAATGPARYQRVIGIFDDVERRQLLKPELRDHVDVAASYLADYFPTGHSTIEARMLADQGTYLCDDILAKVDRDSMLNSLEVRVPFLDHRIVEFANSLPIDMHMHGGDQKHLLKGLLRDRVPSDIVTRGKQGFSMPIRDWLRGSYRDLAEDLLLQPNNRCFDFFDSQTVRHYFEAHLRGPRDLSGRLWALMCFEQWCRTFDV